MTTNQSKVEPLEVASAEAELNTTVKSLIVDGNEVISRIVKSTKEPATLRVEIKSVFYFLYYTPDDGEIPILTFDEVFDKEWVKRYVIYKGILYGGLFEKESYENMVEEVEDLPNLDETGAVFVVGCGSNDNEKGIIGPMHIDNADSIDEKARIFKAPLQLEEGNFLKMRYNGVNYSLYLIPINKQPLTLTFEEAAKSSWRFRDVLSRGEVQKALFIHEIYKKEDEEEGLGPFRIVSSEETIDLSVDDPVEDENRQDEVDNPQGDEENRQEDDENRQGGDDNIQGGDNDNIQEDEESVNSLEPFDRDMLPSDEDYEASQQECFAPFPSNAEQSYPQEPDDSEDYFSVHVEEPFKETLCIQQHIDAGLGDIEFRPEDKFHPYDQEQGLITLQQQLNIKETVRPKTVDMGNQDLGIVLAARKKNRVQYVVQRAAAPIEKVKAMREEMTETQNLTAGYCICFLISILIVVGCSYGLLALLMNPPSFLTEMP